MEIDELRLYSGSNIVLDNGIIIKQPTLLEVIDFGEREYFSSLYTLTSVGADLKWQLFQVGIDYTTIDDYDLFVNFLFPSLINKNENKNPLELFCNINLNDFVKAINNKNQQLILLNQKTNRIIDRMAYRQIVDYVRKINFLTRNNEVPANEVTKEILIEDAKEDYEKNKNKPFESILLPLVSFYKAKCGVSMNDILKTPLYQLFYDLRRVNIINESNLLLQSAYSGFASLKGVDSEKLNPIRKI